MPFRTALSGLNAASAELRVIGNNVANASTTGFKKSRVEFADIFATSNLGSGSNSIGSGVRIANIAQQFDQGNIGFTQNGLDLAISGQGFFRLDDNGTTVYSRAGEFGVNSDGFIVNSSEQILTGYLADESGNITGALGSIQLDTTDIEPRATNTVEPTLNLDASADVPVAPIRTSQLNVDDSGGGGTPQLNGDASMAFTIWDDYGESTAVTLDFTDLGANVYQVDITGATGTMSSSTFTIGDGNDVTLNWDPDNTGSQPTQAITINTSSITASGADIDVSANGSAQEAFDVTDASTYNNSTSLTIYDSLGDDHLATLYYRKTGNPNEWESYLYIDGTPVPNVEPNVPDLFTFTTAGALSTINGAAASSLNTSAFQTGNGSADITFEIDYSTITQYGGGFNVNRLDQDGYSTGRMSGIDISDEGVILARFTNGQSRTMAQIALANFSNAQGLTQLGGKNWVESVSSGAALNGTPGSGSLGLIQSGALEGSNVDLTEQLVGMITAQRNFQANAQVITTADTITQTIINIR